MTTLTDRERELVEAARAICERNLHADLAAALKAYEPKPRTYSMPTWAEFVDTCRSAEDYDGAVADEDGIFAVRFVDRETIKRFDYNAIREALSTEEE